MTRKLTHEEAWGLYSDECNALTPTNKTEKQLILLLKSLQPLPLVYGEFKNSSGKKREYAKPDDFIKAVQGQIIQYLYPRLENSFSPNCYGGIKGRDAQDNIKYARHSAQYGYIHLVKIDQAKAFDNIDHHLLLDALVSTEVLSPELAELIIQKFVKAPLLKNGKSIAKTKGLHIGMPLSPLLFNVFMMSLDSYCTERGYQFTRFYDDICLFFKCPVKAKAAEYKVKKFMAQKLKTTVHPEKSQTGSVFEIPILGYSLKEGRGRKGCYRVLIALSEENKVRFKMHLFPIFEQYKRHKNHGRLIREVNDCIKSYRGFLSPVTSRLFKNEMTEWILTQVVEAIFLQTTGCRGTRFHAYQKLLKDEKAAKSLTSMKLKGAKVTLRRLLSTGQLVDTKMEPFFIFKEKQACS